MDFNKEIPVKRSIKCPLIWATITSALLIVSLSIDYQHELIREHARFRNGFPTRTTWENPPHGKLSCYLFNVTNTEAFLNGTDTKLKLKQVGPIVYRVTPIHSNLVINKEESTLTYRKIRYHIVTFDEASTAPGLLDEKLYLPNIILLSVVTKMHDWFFLARNAFNMYANTEPIFIQRTVHQFLWNYTTPMVENVRQIYPAVLSNAGMLHNAVREKTEFFTVNIGEKNGLENFFKIRTINNHTIFSEQFSRGSTNRETCPIHADNSFDNTLFPPYLKREDPLSIVAGDSCRTLPLVFHSDVTNFNGYSGYKYVIGKDSNASCLKESFGIPLPDGVFDISKCPFDVPGTYSAPHFFGSSYNFSQHLEGLSPNAEDHQTFLYIEPKTGILFEEKFRFQLSIPIPHLSGFNENLSRLSGMIIPSFWYEYDLDDLPTFCGLMIKTTAYYSPYIQKVCILLFFITAALSITQVGCRYYGISLKDALRLGDREMKQTISEVPTSERYYAEANTFLPRKSMKV